MECQKIRKLIPVFIEESLGQRENQLVKDHLAICRDCREELRLLQKSWDLLLDWKDEEPAPGYISRFWTKIATDVPWYERALSGAANFLPRWKFAYQWVAVVVVIVIGALVFSNYIRLQGENAVLAKTTPEDIELVDNIELAEDFDVIDDIDFIQDLEVIDSMELSES